MSKESSKLIIGGKHKDQRGQIQFFNEFDMSVIKRVYFTTHYNTDIVRAWQGHSIESRWFCCVKGKFKVGIIKVDNQMNPSETLEVKTHNLSEDRPEILYIPSGYANGFKALEDGSKLMIMSNYLLNEIENDEFRFDQNKWAL